MSPSWGGVGGVDQPAQCWSRAQQLEEVSADSSGAEGIRDVADDVGRRGLEHANASNVAQRSRFALKRLSVVGCERQLGVADVGAEHDELLLVLDRQALDDH